MSPMSTPHRDPNAESAYYEQMQEEADQEARTDAHQWEWDLANEAREREDMEAGA